jgi:DNA mismatch repair protein MutH
VPGDVRPEPPSSEAQLFARASDLSGRTLGEVAARFDLVPPRDLRRAKGWVGQLFEQALGATARSRASPDFEELGVELKTIPVRGDGVPCESTFVCTINLVGIGSVEWEASLVKRKLSRVLWIPVAGERTIPVEARRIGTPLLWSPSEAEASALQNDWEELCAFIGRGDVEMLTGHVGRYLQVRPKAADGSSRRRGIDRDGASIATLPRGFYLRTRFTGRILSEHFALASQRYDRKM